MATLDAADGHGIYLKKKRTKEGEEKKTNAKVYDIPDSRPLPQKSSLGR